MQLRANREQPTEEDKAVAEAFERLAKQIQMLQWQAEGAWRDLQTLGIIVAQRDQRKRQELESIKKEKDKET